MNAGGVWQHHRVGVYQLHTVPRLHSRNSTAGGTTVTSRLSKTIGRRDGCANGKHPSRTDATCQQAIRSGGESNGAAVDATARHSSAQGDRIAPFRRKSGRTWVAVAYGPATVYRERRGRARAEHAKRPCTRVANIHLPPPGRGQHLKHTFLSELSRSEKLHGHARTRATAKDSHSVASRAGSPRERRPVMRKTMAPRGEIQAQEWRFDRCEAVLGAGSPGSVRSTEDGPARGWEGLVRTMPAGRLESVRPTSCTAHHRAGSRRASTACCASRPHQTIQRFHDSDTGHNQQTPEAS